MYYAVAPSRNTMEYAPQGIVGDLISSFGPTVGGMIGGAAGNQQIGTQLGNLAGQLGSLLPFQATPTAYSGLQPLASTPQAYAPQGWIGEMVSGFAPVVGGMIGSAAGNQQIGTGIGNIASEVARLLPFEATPTAYSSSLQPLAAAPQAYAPQGLIGGMLGGPLGGALGGALGGLFGNRSLGEQIGNGIGGIGGTLLPFSVTPNPYLGQVR
jgi:hypothetical protein